MITYKKGGAKKELQTWNKELWKHMNSTEVVDNAT
jgi:hypothetical protein